jgi:hypothetical protein
LRSICRAFGADPTWTAQVKTTIRWQLQAVDQGTLVKYQDIGLSAHPEVTRSFRWLQVFLERVKQVDDRWSEVFH